MIAATLRIIGMCIVLAVSASCTQSSSARVEEQRARMQKELQVRRWDSCNVSGVRVKGGRLPKQKAEKAVALCLKVLEATDIANEPGEWKLAGQWRIGFNSGDKSTDDMWFEFCEPEGIVLIGSSEEFGNVGIYVHASGSLQQQAAEFIAAFKTEPRHREDNQSQENDRRE